MDDSIGFSNFSVRRYVPFTRKHSVTHMHGLPVYVKEGLPFARQLPLENSAALLHPLLYFFFLCQSPSTSFCTVSDAISYNTDKIFSINSSPKVFVFG